ncbi:hypothetical protein ANO11243_081410 [Dothideomycetidae sp. 11243]|nr:hypothetical protein ANO11243_081410 [fungal sp. No.11243]
MSEGQVDRDDWHESMTHESIYDSDDLGWQKWSLDTPFTMAGLSYVESNIRWRCISLRVWPESVHVVVLRENAYARDTHVAARLAWRLTLARGGGSSASLPLVSTIGEWKSPPTRCSELSISGLPVFQPGLVRGKKRLASGASSTDQRVTRTSSWRKSEESAIKHTTKSSSAVLVEVHVKKRLRIMAVMMFVGDDVEKGRAARVRKRSSDQLSKEGLEFVEAVVLRYTKAGCMHAYS